MPAAEATWLDRREPPFDRLDFLSLYELRRPEVAEHVPGRVDV